MSLSDKDDPRDQNKTVFWSILLKIKTHSFKKLIMFY